MKKLLLVVLWLVVLAGAVALIKPESRKYLLDLLARVPVTAPTTKQDTTKKEPHPPGTSPPFAKLVGDVSVGEVQKGDTLSVPFILWGGDVATFLANGLANGGLKTQSDSLFGRQGLNLELTPGDDFPGQVQNYLSGKSPFLRGTLSMLGQASEVVSADPRTRPVVFLQLTWSAGDHLVARPGCQTLNDLKGKKIALQHHGPHAGMLGDVLRTARLKWSDIQVVWTDDVTGDKGPAARFRKDPSIDACFAITPDMLALTGGLKETGTGEKETVKGAHVLVSTVQMKHSIADVYACRKDFFDAHRDLVEKFTAGYLKACEDLTDLRKQAADRDPTAAEKYKAVLRLAMQIYGKEALSSEDDADGLVGDAVFVGLPGNISFFTDKDMSGFDAKQKAALDLAVALGDARERHEFLKPAFDYDEIKQLGGLQILAKKQTAGPDGKGVAVIVQFTIPFSPSQAEFDEVTYGPDFHDALDQAALFPSALMVIRGHSDLSGLLQSFVRAGMEKGFLTRQGEAGHYQYSWKGEPLELADTKKIVDLIQHTSFAGASTDPQGKLEELRQFSLERAEAVKRAMLALAPSLGSRPDPRQFQVEGVGVLEPVVPVPRTDEDIARNCRVEFRLERRASETSGGGTIDY